MKKMKKVFTIGCLAAVGLSVISGCTPSSSSDEGDDTSSKTINLMLLSELTTLDSCGMLDFPDTITHTAIYEGLYTLDEEDELIPAAAEDMPEVSEDGLTYTITLREDMKWSNGEPVTAHDFEYAWKKLADPANAYVYSFMIQENLKNGEAVVAGEKDVEELGVKATEDLVLEVELAEPKSYFTSVLAFSVFLPQNEKAVEEFGDDYGSSAETVVFNGPFIIENWKQADTTWDLKKNEDYWDAENVKAEHIHYSAIKEGSTALNLFEDGELDLAYLSGTLAEMNADHENFQSYPTATMNYIRYNFERNGEPTILANDNLRKALAMGIDKEALIHNVIADGSIPLYGMVTEGFVKNPVTGVDFREEAGDQMAFDEEKALEYWEAAKEELGDTIEVELMTTDADSYKKLGESIQGEWESRFEGLTVNVRSLPTETALNLAADSDYELFLIYWTPDYQDPISTLNMMHTPNTRNYSNEEYDGLLDQASGEYAMEPGKRWEKLIEAEKVLLEDTAGLIVLSQNQQTVLQNPELTGVTFHTFGAPLTLKTIGWKE